MLISVPTDYSFPSGHMLASAIGATVLTKTNRRFGWAAIPLGRRLSPFPACTCLSISPAIFWPGVLGVAIGEAVHHFGTGLLQKGEALRGS